MAGTVPSRRTQHFTASSSTLASTGNTSNTNNTNTASDTDTGAGTGIMASLPTSASPTRDASSITFSAVIEADHDAINRCAGRLKRAQTLNDRLRLLREVTWRLVRHDVSEDLVMRPAFVLHLGAEGQRMAEHDRTDHERAKEELLALMDRMAIVAGGGGGGGGSKKISSTSSTTGTNSTTCADSVNTTTTCTDSANNTGTTTICTESATCVSPASNSTTTGANSVGLNSTTYSGSASRADPANAAELDFDFDAVIDTFFTNLLDHMKVESGEQIPALERMLGPRESRRLGMEYINTQILTPDLEIMEHAEDNCGTPTTRRKVWRDVEEYARTDLGRFKEIYESLVTEETWVVEDNGSSSSTKTTHVQRRYGRGKL